METVIPETGPFEADTQHARPALGRALFLVRHCRPDEGNTLTPGDPPLTDEGRRHARRVAESLASESIDRIVSSPQLRAIETARPLSNLLALPVELIEGLAEVDRHTDRYRSAETIRTEYPERWDAFVQSPAAFFGLDENAFRRTVLSVIGDLLGGAKQRVAVFSHGTPIKIALQQARGLGCQAPLSVDYGAINQIADLAIGDERLPHGSEGDKHAK